jgi:hypothetical protein
MKSASNFIGQIITRASNRTARFIGLLQAALYAIEPISESMPSENASRCSKNPKLFHADPWISSPNLPPEIPQLCDSA